MGFGQYLLVLGSLVLFSVLINSFYQGENYRLATMIYSEAVITSTGVGQSLLSEIVLKEFDENTINDTLTSPNQLTSSSYLGVPDAGESYHVSTFDDIDDYDGYSRVDSLSQLGAFTTSVKVFYIDPANPDSATTSRTFYKRIDITISTPYLTDPTVINYIYSY